MAANTVMQVAPNIVTFSRATTAASELFALIDRESLIDPFNESGYKPDETSGSIDLHNINFSYPSRPDVTVLDNFTLNIPAGKVTALVVGRRLQNIPVMFQTNQEKTGGVGVRKEHHCGPARMLVYPHSW